LLVSASLHVLLGLLELLLLLLLLLRLRLLLLWRLLLVAKLLHAQLSLLARQISLLTLHYQPVRNMIVERFIRLSKKPNFSGRVGDSPLQLSHLLRIATHTQVYIRYPWLSLRLTLVLTLTLHVVPVAWHAHAAVYAHVLWPAIRVPVPGCVSALRSHHLRTLLIGVLLLNVLSLIPLRHLLLLLLRDDAVVLVQKLSVILL
jgi:hypothetical protein